MSEKEKAGPGKSERQWKRSVKNLEQVTQALKLLSGITVTLNKRVRRAGRYLRTVLNFDEINRLNAPLKGEKSRSRSRRRSARRSSSRRSAGPRRGGWNLSWATKGVKELGKWLKEVWKGLEKFFRSRKWTLPQGFERLAEAAKKLGAQLKGALEWGWSHVLKPLGAWALDKAVPAVVETLAKALEFVSKVLEVLAPLGKALWEHFLAPLAEFTGELVVQALGAVGDAFSLLTDLMGALQGAGSTLAGLWDSLCQKAGDLAQAVSKVVTGEENPLVKLKVVFEKGPADLWKSFRELWEQNPAVKTLVSLVSSGWKSVSGWVTEYIGGGVEKAIGLAKFGWKSVSGWVTEYIGGGVEKAIGLAKSGWKSVSGWVKESLGDNVNKAVGLAKSGWKSVTGWVKESLGDNVNKAVGLAKSGWKSVSGWVKDALGGNVNKAVGLAKSGWKSVSGWVKDSLGKGVSFAVNLVKGWKGTVAKFLGLDNLASKFHIKLPKVEVTWSGKPIKTPHFSLKWNAKGGILNGATVFGMAGNTLLGGGEAGREAVLPLDSNTGWMDRLADKVASRVGSTSGGGSQPIRVQVVLDGRVVAESTVRELRNQVRMGQRPLSELV